MANPRFRIVGNFLASIVLICAACSSSTSVIGGLENISDHYSAIPLPPLYVPENLDGGSATLPKPVSTEQKVRASLIQNTQTQPSDLAITSDRALIEQLLLSSKADLSFKKNRRLAMTGLSPVRLPDDQLQRVLTAAGQLHVLGYERVPTQP